MKKGCLFVCILFITVKYSYAQQQLFFAVQGMAGMGFGKAQQNGSVLKNRSIPWQLNTKLSLQYRVANRFAIETGLGNNSLIWKVKDVAFAQRYNDKFEAKFNNTIGHMSFFSSVQYIQPLGKFEFLYVQLGAGYHLYGSKTLSEQKDFTVDGVLEETTTMTTVYNNGAVYLEPEIGFQQFNYRSLWSAGIAFGINLNGNLFKSTYTATQANGNTIGSDELSASGNYVGINLRYNFSLMHKEAKEKTEKEEMVQKKKPKKEPKAPKPPKEEKNKEPKKEKVKIKLPPKDSVYKEPDGRDYKISKTMRVHVQTVQLKVWDHKTVDGDRINLLLNGNLLIENYKLVTTPKIIEVKLQEGINHIVLHALNLGEYPPNTAAVAVFDGKKWKRLILESDMDKSGALQLVYTP